MIFPCPRPCNPCGNGPLANLTSEASDGPSFVDFSSGFGLQPPLGDTFNNPFSFAYCVSQISQADAFLCATNTEIVNQINDPPFDGGHWRDPRGNPVPIFTNNQTAFTAFCPDGAPFVFTIPVGLYKGATQIDADRTAQSFAQVQANLNKVCLGTLPTFVCANATYQSTLLVQGRGAFTFAIFAGSLPPGITLTITGPNTALFSGTPTSPGNYTFTVQAVNSLGYYMRKQYTIEVLGLTSPSVLPVFTTNQPYSFQFTAAGGTAPYAFTLTGGSLPAGMSLSNSGLLSGTPTSTTDASFTIGVSSADFVSNTCTGNFTLPHQTVSTIQAYFKLDELTGVRVDSINGNNLAEVNGAVGNEAGIINNAAKFTGASLGTHFLRSNSNSAYVFANDFTLSFWVFPSSAAIGSQGIMWASQFLIETGAVSSPFFFVFNPGLTSLAPFFAWTADAWNHIVLTWSAGTSTMNIYLNAVLKMNRPGLGSLTQAAQQLNIGTGNGGEFQNTMEGGLDEIGCWPRVLSASEITALYNGGSALALGSPGFPP